MKARVKVKVRAFALVFYISLAIWASLSIILADMWVRLLVGMLFFYLVVLIVSSIYRLRELIKSI